MRCFIGIDGGGSKTTCAVAGEAGDVLAAATSGPSNYHALGIDAAAAVMAGVVEEAVRAVAVAGAVQVEIAGLCLALAGVARPEDRDAWREAVRGLMVREQLPVRWRITAEEVVITHDAMAALVAGTGRRQGVVVIAGTGSIAFGRNAGGDERRASGWGYLLGDEGSGYWIALQGLRAVCRADDGRGPMTALTDALLRASGVTRPQELIRPMYGAWKPVDVAALAPVVLRVAAGGDAVAGQIVDSAAAELADAAHAVLSGLGLGESANDAQVVIAGGLWDDALMCARFTSMLSRTAPSARIIRPLTEPVGGALLLARGAA